MSRLTRYGSLLLAALALIGMLAACSNEQPQEPNPDQGVTPASNMKDAPAEKIEELLGIEDQNLVNKKGEGSFETYEENGKEMIVSREYIDSVFDMDADVVFLISDEGTVSRITCRFDGLSEDQVLEQLEKKLGTPEEELEESGPIDDTVLWKKDGIIYTAFFQSEVPVTLQIEQSIE